MLIRPLGSPELIDGTPPGKQITKGAIIVLLGWLLPLPDPTGPVPTD